MSTTTYDVCTVERAGNDLLAALLGTSAGALAPATQRAALLVGAPSIAFLAGGPGGGVRPRVDHRSVVLGGRERWTTTSPKPLSPAAGAVSGTHRPFRSCGTPVPGSAPSDTAP